MTDGRDTPMYEAVMRLGRIPDIDQDGAFRKVVQSVRKGGVPIYFIALNTDRNPTRDDRSIETRAIASSLGKGAAESYLLGVRQRMERLAEVTGGLVLYPKSLNEVAPLYETIGRELGAAYSLGYTPGIGAEDGTARAIEVRVRRDNVKVIQSRNSYVPR